MRDPVILGAEAARPRRVVAAVVLGGVIVTGLVVHRWGPGGAFGDIAGDALYAVAAYLAAVVVLPRVSPIAVGGIALAWCVAVEVFQLTGLPLVWGAAVPWLKLVLGTGFDARDLVVYAAAVAASVVVYLVANRWIPRRNLARTDHRPAGV